MINFSIPLLLKILLKQSLSDFKSTLKVKTLLLPFFLFSSVLLIGQSSDLGNWLIAIGSKKIDNRFNWHHEIQYRNYNAIGDLEQLLLRTGVGYNLTENNNNLLLGYGFIRSENYIGFFDQKIVVNEHRIFQQFVTKQSIGPVLLQHRYRFEQLWVEKNFRMRLRYFLAAKLPLSKEGLIPNSWYLSAYNEIFLNTEPTVFDRNRLYGGVGYKINDHFRVELGYMNQFLDQRNRDQVNVFLFSSF